MDELVISDMWTDFVDYARMLIARISGELSPMCCLPIQSRLYSNFALQWEEVVEKEEDGCVTKLDHLPSSKRHNCVWRNGVTLRVSDMHDIDSLLCLVRFAFIRHINLLTRAGRNEITLSYNSQVSCWLSSFQCHCSCFRRSISHNPFYDMLAARKKKAQKNMAKPSH